MANRSFERGFYSLEVNPVRLWCVITIGATGAPTLTRGQGVASVTRTGAGAYTITLSDKYNYFLGADIAVQRAGYYSGLQTTLDAVDVTSAKTVKFACYDAAGSGTAWDPISGSVVFVTIDVRNSSVS